MKMGSCIYESGIIQNRYFNKILVKLENLWPKQSKEQDNYSLQETKQNSRQGSKLFSSAIKINTNNNFLYNKFPPPSLPIF